MESLCLDIAVGAAGARLAEPGAGADPEAGAGAAVGNRRPLPLLRLLLLLLLLLRRGGHSGRLTELTRLVPAVAGHR